MWLLVVHGTARTEREVDRQGHEAQQQAPTSKCIRRPFKALDLSGCPWHAQGHVRPHMERPTHAHTQVPALSYNIPNGDTQWKPWFCMVLQIVSGLKAENCGVLEECKCFSCGVYGAQFG